MSSVKPLLGLFVLCLFFAQSFAQNPGKETLSLEQIINQTLHSYALTSDNQFKLAAYTELKGRYAGSVQTLMLNFGGLGYISFFPKNLLFRTTQNQVFHLNRYETQTANSVILNQQLTNMFEHIILMGNHGADPRHVEFVDKELATKNIEPFDKVFLRHILIKYGRYDSLIQEVSFHTDWLPERTFVYRGPKDEKIVKRHITPLSIKLNEKILRGYYLNNGGTVFVEDVNRNVIFATGEEYDYNVAAFKLFLQKLFVQTVQYLAKTEAKRLEVLAEGQTVMTEMVTYDSEVKQQDKYVAGAKRKAYFRKTVARPTVKPLYDHLSWIPMMLSILRLNEINIGRKDVIKYFIDQPYFPKIYEQLIPEEKSAVDAYQKSATKLDLGR